jgi:hypothetical protein
MAAYFYTSALEVPFGEQSRYGPPMSVVEPRGRGVREFALGGFRGARQTNRNDKE